MTKRQRDELLDVLRDLRQDLPIVAWSDEKSGYQQAWYEGRPLTAGRLRELISRNNDEVIPAGSGLVAGMWIRNWGSFTDEGAARQLGWSVNAIRILPPRSARSVA